MKQVIIVLAATTLAAIGISTEAVSLNFVGPSFTLSDTDPDGFSERFTLGSARVMHVDPQSDSIFGDPAYDFMVFSDLILDPTSYISEEAYDFVTKRYTDGANIYDNDGSLLVFADLTLTPVAVDGSTTSINPAFTTNLTLQFPDPNFDGLIEDGVSFSSSYPGGTVPYTPNTPIPEPSTLLLLGSGLIGAYAFGRRQIILRILSYEVWKRRKNIPAQAIMTSSSGIPAAHYATREERLVIIGKMTSMVIHDVKNSFTAIRSCAEVIGDDDLDPYHRKDFARMIVGEIEHGVEMTQELLEFSGGQQGKLHVTMCSVKELIHDILVVIEYDFARRNIAVQTQLHYTGPVEIDGKKMNRVFMNIITNARDAMLDGGTMTIASRRVNGEIQFEFSDTGCGMSPELQARMFEPFVTTGKSHGTGLGMVIVKDILDQHHAYIEVESVIKQGTTITITLSQNIC